ncbi:nucleotidyl transferase AbiEii/AbiGii toxin family protein [bacterium]|nr:nucleotidyl transferase AbiEii/AbiGii toxin family protein [bacterium]
MNPKEPKNLPASVRQQLLNISRETDTNYQLLLIRYAIERLLYRLSISPYQEQFILKGAMLFAIWSGIPQRGTRDLDLLAYGENNPDAIRAMMHSIIQQPVDNDGLIFDENSIRIDEIREPDAYNGYRIRLKVLLEKAEIPVQVDLGFGDAVTPEAQLIDYPGLLHFPATHLRAYTPETVIAEKLQAIVNLGIANSRIKDYYDLFVILDHFNLSSKGLALAIQATFQRRTTNIPTDIPSGLSNEFAQDTQKQSQWRQFLRRQQLDAFTEDLPVIVHRLRETLMPVFGLALQMK